MPIGIPEQPLQHPNPLEEQSFVLLVRDADPTKELDRVLGNEPAAVGELELGGRYVGLPCFRVFVIDLDRREDRCRLAEFRLGVHVARDVLKRLKRADRHSELLALLQVGDGAFEELENRALPFGTGRCRAAVDRLLDDREGLALSTDDSIGIDLDAPEYQNAAATKPKKSKKGSKKKKKKKRETEPVDPSSPEVTGGPGVSVPARP